MYKVPLSPIAAEVYVIKTAKNRAISLLNRKRAEAGCVEHVEDMELFEDWSVVSHSGADDGCHALLENIRKLKPIYRDVLILYYLNGQNTREIAALLHRKPDIVKRQLARGRRMLQGALQQAENFPESSG